MIHENYSFLDLASKEELDSILNSEITFEDKVSLMNSLLDDLITEVESSEIFTSMMVGDSNTTIDPIMNSRAHVPIDLLVVLR